jgi:Ca2+-binding RTX toxin-like protein
MTDITGTPEDDFLPGTSGDDQISGGDGGDLIQGLGGNDVLNGDAGDDAVRGNAGDDQLYGGDGNDNLRGGSGVDSFDGGSNTEDPNPTSSYGDRISFYEPDATQGVVADLRTGVISNDGFGNVETMVGIESLGSDTAFVDTFYGNDGTNALLGGRGDLLYGFGGQDIFFLSVAAVVDGGTDTDTLGLTSGGGWLMPDEDGDGIAETAAAASAGWVVDLSTGYLQDGYGNIGSVVSVEVVNGSELNDTLIANSSGSTLDGADGNDVLIGNDGNDILSGSSGHDYLEGGAGDDSLNGGDDDDYLYGNAGDDLIDGGAGWDRAGFAAGATAGITVDLRLQGTAQDTGQGFDTLVGIEHVSGTIFDDVIIGDDGDNWLWGGSDGSGVTGNDTISGGGGDDLVEVGAGNHQLDGGDGTDTLLLYGNGTDMSGGVTFSLAAQGADQDTGQGMMNASGFENLVGSIHDDSLSGDDGDDLLAGAQGNDTLSGGAGNDTLYGDGIISPDTHGNGGSGPITLTEDMGAAGGDSLYGGDGDDALIGGAGNDLLDGGEGNDFMAGGSGDDVYVVGNGDGIVENAGEGTDEVRTSVDWGLQDNVENLTATGSGDIYLGGNDLDNVITGNSGNNYLVGGGGNDTLDGGDGRDVAAFHLAHGTTGSLQIVDGPDGTLLVQLVQEDGSFEDVFQVTISGTGEATVTGLGSAAGLGTDTVSSVEELHFMVDTYPDPTPDSQFTYVSLAANAPPIVDNFAHVEGSAVGEVIDLAALYPNAGPETSLNSFGNGGDDTIIGHDGPNYIGGGTGDDTIFGGEGDDGLDGGSGNDTISGGGGNDYIDGNEGDDSIDGGAGQDIVAFRLPPGTSGSLRAVDHQDGTFSVQLVHEDGSFEDVFEVSVGSTGSATVTGVGMMASFGTDTISNAEDMHFYVDGSALPEQFAFIGLVPYVPPIEGDFAHVSGSAASEVIDLAALYPDAGPDTTINSTGGGGNDTILGTLGSNYIRGDAGDDVIDGRGGGDVAAFGLLAGMTGTLQTVAGTGDNAGQLIVERVDGETVEQLFIVTLAEDGTATVQGINSAAFLGTDTVSGVSTLDFVVDNPEFDPNQFTHILVSGAVTDGNDVTFGSGESDLIAGGAGDDVLRGFEGDDVLRGGDGTDFLVAGVGDDYIDGGAGLDRASFSNGTGGVTVDLNLQGQAQDTGQGMDVLAGIENVNGSNFDDVLIGDGGDNWLWGLQGNDTINGGAGNDLIDVGAGNHTLDGGEGNDTLVTFTDAPGTLLGPVDVSLALQGGSQDTGQGSMTLSGFENLSGSNFDDTLTGDDADNRLGGDAGNDTLVGGGGNDSLYGDGGAYFDGQSPGATWIEDPTSLGVFGDDILYGGDGDDTLIGGGGNDTLDGGTGFDVLTGGAGDDVYLVSDGDAIIENADEGVDEVRTTIDWGLAPNVENLTAVEGSGAFFLGGNELDNVITGNSGDNYLVGAGGDDTLDGGAGRDVAAFHLPPGTTGSLRIADGPDGTLLVQLVQADGSSEDLFSVVVSGTGAATVTGLGIMSGLGTDSITSIEELHFLVDNYPDPTPDNQFAFISLAAYVPPLVDGFAHVSGSVIGEVIDLAALYPDAGPTDNINTTGGAGDDTILGTTGFNYIRGDSGDDVIDGRGGGDVAAFALPVGMTGSLRVVQGTGEQSGMLVVERVDGETVEQLFLVSIADDGTATVQGINSAAFLGTDTVSNVSTLDFVVDNPVFDPNQFTHILLQNGTAVGEEVYGSGENDGQTGGSGNDALWGFEGDDLLRGGNDHDTIRGGDGDDSIYGGQGDDYLIGGAGNDLLDGGDGSDRVGYFAGAVAGVTIDLNIEGTPQDTGSQGWDTLVGVENVSGTQFSDVLIGNDGDNWLWGSPAAGSLTNNDTISGGGGNDLVTVGIGNHILDGGSGVDSLRFTENAGADPSVNVSLALQGTSQVTGGGSWTITGFENLAGGNGNDTLTGDGNSNVLAGSWGDDTLAGGAGNDTLYGDGDIATDNHGAGGSGPITTFDDVGGGEPAGNDLLEGGLGDDIINGGGGNDTATYANAAGAVLVDLAAGAASGADGNDTLTGIENVIGSGFDDSISGDLGANRLDGGDGSDLINGRGGDDAIYGGDGDDLLRGGGGNDQLVGGDGGDNLRGGSGVDSFDGGANPTGWTLSAGYGDRISFFEFDATQGVVADLRTGVISNDGFGNSETMVGIESLGSDTAFVDTFHGNDEQNALFGNKGDLLYGHGGDDDIEMSSAASVADGGDGVDTIGLASTGGWLMADANGDGLAEQAAAATSGWTVNLAMGSAVDGYGNTGTVTGIENVNGSELGDTITGDANGNALDGRLGDDVLVGGGGNDTITGGDGADLAVFALPSGTSGTLSVVAGSGSDSGKLFVMLADGATTAAVAEVTTAADGTITVTGVGAGVGLGTDTVSQVEQLLFSTGSSDPSAPGALNLDAAQVLSGGYAGVTGVVADGLIAGATVFRDANGNGQWDAGEVKTLTASDGTFTLSGGSGPLVALGGTNTDTGLANMLRLTAPSGSTVVNPLTTLVQAVLESSPPGTSAEQAAQAVAEALGLSTSIDLLNTDVFSAATAGDPAALEAQKAAATIVTIIAAGTDASGSEGAADSIVNNLATLVGSGTPVDLTDQGTIETALAGALTDAQIEAVASNVAQAAEDIAAATDLDDLSDAQGAALTSGNDLDNVLAGGSLNDELFGFGGNDQLSGNDGDDRLDGGAGNDSLDGGAGVDTAVYSSASGPVVASLLDGKSTGAGTDTFVSIENVVGSNFADRLTGDGGNNLLDGGAGNDVLSGGVGNDRLIGGAGADRLDGGSGCDTADYGSSSAGVSVNLASGKFSGGDATGDTLLSIENVTGSAFADKLIGSTGSNVLNGGAGNDTINGGNGADTLWGGTGSDLFVFKTASEVGAGSIADQIMDFEAGGAGVGGLDKIDLSPIDAIARSSRDDAFTFIGDQGFSKKAGELQVVAHDGVATVSGDLNGDGRADFTLVVHYTGSLDASDFIL